MNWEIGIGIYTLMCIKQITNKNLLYKKINKIKFKKKKKKIIKKKKRKSQKLELLDTPNISECGWETQSTKAETNSMWKTGR